MFCLFNLDITIKNYKFILTLYKLNYVLKYMVKFNL